MSKVMSLVSALAIAAALLVGTAVITTPATEAGDPTLSRNYHVWCGICGDPCETQCDPNWRPDRDAWCSLTGCEPGVSCVYTCSWIG